MMERPNEKAHADRQRRRRLDDGGGSGCVARVLYEPAAAETGDHQTGGVQSTASAGVGDLDIFAVNSSDFPGHVTSKQTPTSHLYRNDGNMRFTDVTQAAGLA